jgi:hypothetical protein
VKRRHFPPTASETRERERERERIEGKEEEAFFSGRAAIKEKLAMVLDSKKGITN